MRKLTGLLLIIILAVACNAEFDKGLRRNYSDVNSMIRAGNDSSKYLKAHARNGDVYLFMDQWQLSGDKSTLFGNDVEHYNARRSLVNRGVTELPLHEIVLLETNMPVTSFDNAYLADLGILTVLNTIITMYCISNPKACWGSCPTFYYDNDQNLFASRAEGFSSSITPSTEKGDIDALDNPQVTSGDFKLVMKNEAMETHAVNQVELLAVPRHTGTRVYQDTEDNFFECTPATPPSCATGPEGDIRVLLGNSDGQERYSLTDAEDLHSKETLDLSFHSPEKGLKGIVLVFRQSLLPTFLFYSALSYMGDEVSDVLAGVETNPLMKSSMEASFKHLGGIEVLGWNEKQSEWQKLQTLFEAGPIARNQQIIPLPASFGNQKEIRIRLRMSRGLWRMDYAGLTTLKNTVTPVHLKTVSVMKNGINDASLPEKLSNDDKQYLLSLPGDRYVMGFELPDQSQDYELFVYSKGYYLEWMRKEWLKGKDIPKLKKMVMGDEKTWKDLAREFKQYEPTMESSFWNSRLDLSIQNPKP